MSFYRVKAPFATPTKVHNAGSIISSNDPDFTKSRMQFLEPLVEQATAAPGERRMVRMPAPRPAAEKAPAEKTGLTTKSLPKARKGK